MKQITAVDWLGAAIQLHLNFSNGKLTDESFNGLFKRAKEMEKNDTDNKVIHFAEWLTKKHTSTLITLYEHFEEEYYKETFKTE